MPTLRPRDQTQGRQYLRLDPQRNIELRDDIIDPQWHTSHGPKEHHRRLQALRMVSTIINYDLRDELDGPADLIFLIRQRR